jgi:hypothetical protein
MPTQSVLDKLEPLEEIPEVAIVDLAATVLEEARERWVAASDAYAGVSGPNPTPAALRSWPRLESAVHIQPC